MKKPTSATSQVAVLVECNVEVTLNFINGLMFGIGHIEGDPDEDYHYIIAVCFAFLQLTFIKYK